MAGRSQASMGLPPVRKCPAAGSPGAVAAATRGSRAGACAVARQPTNPEPPGNGTSNDGRGSTQAPPARAMPPRGGGRSRARRGRQDPFKAQLAKGARLSIADAAGVAVAVSGARTSKRRIGTADAPSTAMSPRAMAGDGGIRTRMGAKIVATTSWPARFRWHRAATAEPHRDGQRQRRRTRPWSWKNAPQQGRGARPW